MCMARRPPSQGATEPAKSIWVMAFLFLGGLARSAAQITRRMLASSRNRWHVLA
jgi:hypothetical protein